MEFLTNILENSTLPWVTAFILGIMTAISPCPMATNITAIGFISKDLEDKKSVFVNGLLYTLGRGTSYTLLALILYFGADQIKFGGFFQQYGEKILGPSLILIGLFMLGVFRLNLPGLSSLTGKMENKSKWNRMDAFLLGMLFALAFCPYSGVLFFGMLIPMTVASASGLYLPLIFAIATGIPVILFSWILAFSIGSVGKVYNKIKQFERYFRIGIAWLFIGMGMYYMLRFF